MTRYSQCRLLVLISGFLVMGCTATSTEPETITIRQQTPGQSERFTQVELDVAYRKQAREYARALLDPGNDFTFCCVVFQSDVEMLEKVLAHFREHVSVDDIDGYGMLIQENQDYYIVSFLERYREATQYQIEGFWYPGISEVDGLRQYGYLVDRDTLEILEFEVIPR